MGFHQFGFRAVLFALLLWILTEGAMNSWLVGAPVVVFAVFASGALLPSVSWSLLGIVRFVPFFSGAPCTVEWMWPGELSLAIGWTPHR